MVAPTRVIFKLH